MEILTTNHVSHYSRVITDRRSVGTHLAVPNLSRGLVWKSPFLAVWLCHFPDLGLWRYLGCEFGVDLGLSPCAPGVVAHVIVMFHLQAFLVCR